MLSKKACGQGVEDGVQGAVDGEDEDDYPAGNGAYGRRVVSFSHPVPQIRSSDNHITVMNIASLQL